jgi:hypothetical protein
MSNLWGDGLDKLHVSVKSPTSSTNGSDVLYHLNSSKASSSTSTSGHNSGNNSANNSGAETNADDVMSQNRKLLELSKELEQLKLHSQAKNQAQQFQQYNMNDSTRNNNVPLNGSPVGLTNSQSILSKNASNSSGNNEQSNATSPASSYYGGNLTYGRQMNNGVDDMLGHANIHSLSTLPYSSSQQNNLQQQNIQHNLQQHRLEPHHLQQHHLQQHHLQQHRLQQQQSFYSTNPEPRTDWNGAIDQNVGTSGMGAYSPYGVTNRGVNDRGMNSVNGVNGINGDQHGYGGYGDYGGPHGHYQQPRYLNHYNNYSDQRHGYGDEYHRDDYDNRGYDYHHHRGGRGNRGSRGRNSRRGGGGRGRRGGARYSGGRGRGRSRHDHYDSDYYNHSAPNSSSISHSVKASVPPPPSSNVAPTGPDIDGLDSDMSASDRERIAFNAGPGPPIQTSANDQGPDGANLFCFHIPNWCSNRQLYDLFAPHGSVISCRIFVDKISGRSRGFGFVSYDRPESAVMAIEHMNGYELGHKRLKVEIKRSKRGNGGGGGGGGGGQYDRGVHQNDHLQSSQPDYIHPSTFNERPPLIESDAEGIVETATSSKGEDISSYKQPPIAPSVTPPVDTTLPPVATTVLVPTESSVDLSLKLWKAAGQGNLSLVIELYELGAKLDWQHPSRDGQTAIHQACQFDQQSVVEWLLQHDVDVHSIDFEGNTSLHVTSMYGHASLLNYLITTSNGNASITNTEGQTPLDLAKIYKKDKTILLLDSLISK